MDIWSNILYFIYDEAEDETIISVRPNSLQLYVSSYINGVVFHYNYPELMTLNVYTNIQTLQEQQKDSDLYRFVIKVNGTIVREVTDVVAMQYGKFDIFASFTKQSNYGYIRNYHFENFN